MIRGARGLGSMLTIGLLVYWNDSGARGAECNADKPIISSIAQVHGNISIKK